MSIRKRTWKSNVAEQTAWVVDYVDQHGARRLKTFALKKDAETRATTPGTKSRRGFMPPRGWSDRPSSSANSTYAFTSLPILAARSSRR
jgi:hypothetical protein